MTIQNSPKGFFGGAISVDGGETLTPFTGDRIEPERFQGLGSGPLIYAVDTTSHFRDRIYALWLHYEVKSKSQQIMLSYSTDRGRSWRSPRTIAPFSKNNAQQYLPMAVVNGKGVLGIFWFEAYPPNHETYDCFFSASVDGGLTFFPPRRVTSQSSEPDSSGNRMITQIGGIRKKSDKRFFSAYSRWRRAGEYTGLTADADGVFHPFWPDARRGAFQLYTSRISVEAKPSGAVPSLGSEAFLPVDDEVNLEFGPAIARSPGSDEVIVARLRNVSGHTIWGPLAVTVTTSLSGLGGMLDSTYDPQIIFDPESNQWSKQARIDYTPALRDIPFLAPGAATEAIEWRFRNVSGGQLNLSTHVYAGSAPRK